MCILRLVSAHWVACAFPECVAWSFQAAHHPRRRVCEFVATLPSRQFIAMQLARARRSTDLIEPIRRDPRRDSYLKNGPPVRTRRAVSTLRGPARDGTNLPTTPR